MIGFLAGLFVTIKTGFRRPVTAQYPDPKKTQNFAWTQSLCIPKTRNNSTILVDPKLMHPTTRRRLHENPQYFACGDYSTCGIDLE